jgi:nucleotide-binding universal stress UspA family protein
MKTILCPVDFSTSSVKAAEWASLIAMKKDWKLVLLNNYMIFSEEHIKKHPDSKNPSLDAKKDTEEKLMALKNQLCKKYSNENLECNVMAEYGFETDKVIAEASKSIKADMIVMGTEGAEKFSDILLGSNTSNLIYKADVPVLVVPVSSEVKLPESIVYTTDLLDEDKEIIKLVIDFAFHLNAKLNFLHVATKSNSRNFNEIKNYISNCIAENGSNKSLSDYEFDVVEGDNVFNSIQDYCKDKNIGLIVAGRHKKNFVERLFMGDLTRMLALHSFVPLLVVQKKQ